MAFRYNSWIWRKYNPLIFIILITEVYKYLYMYYYPDLFYVNFLNGVNGQLNLWVDRQLVIQIIESMPHNQNTPSKLRCPRSLPEIHRHIPEHLFLVFNGLLLHEALDRISLSAHRPIPPRIDMLRVKWRAGFERVSNLNPEFHKFDCGVSINIVDVIVETRLLTYNIDLKSMNHTLLHTPLLNIAKSGYIPATQSDVQISLPCTGRFTGIAPFQVRLDVQREFEGLRKIPPISFIVYKYCLSASQHTRFIIKCECRAQCLQSNIHNRHSTRKRCIRRCRKRFGLNNSKGKQMK
ncbi:Protein shifted isoform 2 [Schistosoma japonicum]|uniref:Protein shifted isoform 2 n=2 Tax=Schistosoma japonicum TaxID=6182 RepID=A0A4Z2CVF4_SCHJA|nr:Protein shifted [Schistosoma japonicum]TNN08163.1 Protein shifted isoform 2 [Schistosoma japonicum]